jgi:hypothetical protein
MGQLAVLARVELGFYPFDRKQRMVNPLLPQGIVPRS